MRREKEAEKGDPAKSIPNSAFSDRRAENAELGRREFLKLSLATAAAGAVLPALPREALAGTESREVSRTTGKAYRPIPSTCLQCYARCGIFAYLAYGRVAKIGGNPAHPNSRGRLCAKGQAGLNLLYDPERLLFPQRRVGARGDGRWRPITWNEALTEIAGRIRGLMDQGRAGEIVFQSSRDVPSASFMRRFCHAIGTPNALVAADLAGTNKAVAHRLSWGVDMDINDVASTMYMLNFGSNPYEAHALRTSFAQRISEAHEVRVQAGHVLGRAKTVTFDVRVSQTAGRSDEWIPIKPGTDAAVALAMARVILDAGLADQGFVERWTNVTLEQLRKHLEEATPEWAERISGVKAADIRRIALEFGTADRATTISAGGVSKHANGVQAERAVFLLNVISGNIERPGGACRPVNVRFAEPKPVPPEPAAAGPFFGPDRWVFSGHEAPHEVLSLVKSGKAKVGFYLSYQHNPAYAFPDGGLAEEVLEDESLIPFHVALDTHLSETAALADIVLPAATYLERTELESPPSYDLVPFVSLRQAVVRPRGESKPVRQVLIDLAKLLGPDVARYFPFDSLDEVVMAEIAAIPGLLRAGGLDYLKRHGVWVDPEAKPAYLAYEREGFRTPSGKIEIASPRLEAAGFKALPSYEPIAAHERLGERELHLTTFQWNVHTHQATANCLWLSEILHDNPAWIHTRTAERLGLANGDRVRLSSAQGSIETKVWVTEGVHPEVVAIGDSCGHWALGRVARAEAFESEDANTRLIWWKHQGAGVHPHRVLPAASDPIGGGPAMMDGVVRVERVEPARLAGKLALGAALVGLAALGQERSSSPEEGAR